MKELHVTHIHPARRVCTRLLPVLALLLLAGQASAQGTAADYERAKNLDRLTRGKVFRSRVQPQWYGNGARFWYTVDLPGGGEEFVRVDAEKGLCEPAFEHEKLAAALSRATGKPVEASRLPLSRLEFVDGDDAVIFTSGGKNWRFDRKTGELTEVASPPAAPAPPPAPPRPAGASTRGGTSAESPDGRWRTVLKDHNLFIKDTKSGEEHRLTSDGTADNGYSERGFWSPDSSRLVAVRTKRGGDRKVYLVESSPKDQLQPKLHSYDYLKPGDPIEQRRPHLFDVVSKKEISVSDSLFPNPWRITHLRWAPDSRRFTFQYNQRGHQVLRIIAIDAASGQCSAIVDEQSPTFIDYAHKEFTHHLNDTGELIWMSERDGWNHLYLYDSATGKVKNQITRGEWVVRGVDLVDEKRRQIWFRAGGIHPQQDPYYVHYCRVNFDGSGLTLLTAGDGTHTIAYSPDRRFFVDTYSRVDMPPVTELRSAESGRLVCPLEKGDWTELQRTGWKAPERFVCKGRDGKTDIYGVIYRPTTFDASKRYPVIESIYAGPQGSFVPNGFSPLHSPQSLAELGFIVVQIDGMGTSNRSKAFHDAAWKNLGDSGLPDRILWMQAASRKYPYMDITRVGVYGGSAGGQSAMRALLAHPEFYKVGVASCGCHDNRMDKIWWNELWMGWPLGPHYEEQSNVTQAHRLQGKLLLIVGELDRNVDPASTMQVVNALVKADKDFDLLVVPGEGHGMGGAYGLRRLRDFFVRHLLGVEPRAGATGTPAAGKSGA